MFEQIITEANELRALIGEPSKLVKNKVIKRLDDHCVHFISKSPFVFIGTTDGNGNLDVSPRGDQAGFVRILDENYLIIPERRGNKRMDTLYNLLMNPGVGLLFIIPGLGETLRVNGKGYVVKDPDLLECLGVNGKTPNIGIGVKVEECFIHCAKAFIRSELWNPTTWPDKNSLPQASKILAAHASKLKTRAEDIEIQLKEGYTTRLY
ncbi:pyridoxamine 5'-phosphate oxidase family protein [Bacillus sp. D386]|uniref:pyridoxamine 5'-phosphate oxidase family protein n=1 Tax=Bacillus sp. D386 TaxID=2587155 RepID=UPI00112401EA|nr:pyridoxamine 5'-phosphate oxidase family protein [Bacillus sp. D386]